MNTRLRIGLVGRPHGTRGAFRVAQPTERLELLEPGQRLYLGDRQVTIEWRKGQPSRPIVKLQSVDERDAVELLNGTPLTVPREALAPLEQDEYLIDDLIGCSVSAEGTIIGRVQDVLLLPSVEALEVGRGERAPLLVPLVADAVAGIDLEARTIDVNLTFLEEDRRW